jgi:hypothetical protein
MKIVLIQSGPNHEILVLGSLLIGLHKKYPGCQIIWAGNPKLFELMKYNRRIKRCVDINQDLTFSDLSIFYNTDLCINPSSTKDSRKFASSVSSKRYLGFTKTGAVDRHAEFFGRIMNGSVTTHKTILDLYFALADLKWAGEGYGLSYYPRKRQEKGYGTYLSQNINIQNASPIKLPKQLLPKFDAINQFREIHTDDLFVAHAGIALRKIVHFHADLPYELEFFNKSK